MTDEREIIQINYDFHAPLTEGLRDAIGAVCMHWGLLELMLERVVAFQTNYSTEVQFTSDFSKNLEALERRIKQEDAQPILRQVVQELVDKARELREDRHRIAHGLWHIAANGDIISFFPQLKRKVVPERTMTIEQIHDIKRAIFDLSMRFRQFAEASDSVILHWKVKSD